MRIAVLIIGLLLSVGLFIQSLAGNALTTVAEDEGCLLYTSDAADE